MTVINFEIPEDDISERLEVPGPTEFEDIHGHTTEEDEEPPEQRE